MKKVLVIGENSYIGKSFQEFAKEGFKVFLTGARNDEWKNFDFAGFDSVVHCAGIAHVPRKSTSESLYYEVNCDLAARVAKKSKECGAGQFIYLSSMSVYNSSEVYITLKTNPSPECAYGASKLKAEQLLQGLSCPDFKICIVRPPMVYGRGCKGNFPRLVKLAKWLPVFPDINNQRSMIYIENLCAFIGFAINGNFTGVFLPQNREYVNTTQLVKSITMLQGKTIRTTKLFNPVISLLENKFLPLGKMFGSMVYEHGALEEEYNIVGFDESIKRCVNGFPKIS